MPFLPTERVKGEQFDFIMISVDAYVDHPSFGHAIISRLVESQGFSIGIIPQPLSEAEYRKLGEPKYAFLISGGVVDSMVNNYSVSKTRRKRDDYSEGGRVGRTPDRAVSYHATHLRKYFPNSYIIIGGIEASLRRFAHYDYWSDSVMPSILLTSKADLLTFGMGENFTLELCERIHSGEDIRNIKDIRGSGYLSDADSLPDGMLTDFENVAFLPSFEAVASNKKEYVKAFKAAESGSDPYGGKILLQKHGKKYVVMNRAAFPADRTVMDMTYALPYMRTYHPMYVDGVPSIEEVKFSITSHRGCFGNCAYCAITMHQGRYISSRSEESILSEAEKLIEDKDFKGYIHDFGGPSADMRVPQCEKSARGVCLKRQCIGYAKCPNLKVDHSEYMAILRKLRNLPKVKKVFIRSGIRYDYLMMDNNYKSILKELSEHHISGQLKVAPEHCSNTVLKRMNKPPFEVYKKFAADYAAINKTLGKEQFLVPYLISSHPGCTPADAIALAEYLNSIHYMPLQVQDFYPTPSSRSTTEYYTEMDVDTLEHIYVAKTPEEKAKQRALLQYRMPKNAALIRQILTENNRRDLIGSDKRCLVPKK